MKTTVFFFITLGLMVLIAAVHCTDDDGNYEDEIQAIKEDSWLPNGPALRKPDVYRKLYRKFQKPAHERKLFDTYRRYVSF